MKHLNRLPRTSPRFGLRSSSRLSSMRRVDPVGLIFISGVVLVAFLFAIATVIVPLATKSEAIFTVNKMERIAEGSNSKYLVYTDKGVYENTDSLVLGKFNSSDLYNQMKEGSTYEAVVTGFRIPILSSYKNIIKVKLVE